MIARSVDAGATPAPASDVTGRFARGSLPAQVRELRELHASGEHTITALGARYGVHRATIYRLVDTAMLSS